MLSTELDTFTRFGELLRYLRQRARLTQKELGLAVGYSDAQITRLESGQRTPDPAVVRARFIDALQLKDAPDLAQRLIDLAAAADQKVHDAPSPATVTRVPPPPEQRTNLLVQLTPTIGREPDIDEVQRLVKARRLVTLTGSGGVGKTRLAIEVGKRLLDDFPAGVWLVELAPVVDESLAPQAVAAVFGLHEHQGQAAAQALATYLADKPLLIVLDNCEHMIAACASLVEQLEGACPRLHVLATSREALRVPGETAWRVPSLAIPAPDAPLILESLRDCESVQLFVQQAVASQTSFTLTNENASAVAHICRHLDGIPLAIEMAAARLPGLSVGEIAALLDRRFELLTGGRRTALPRQQTLRAALDWSYRLLDEPERVVLERLSVFVDGCMADAAAVVCADMPPSTRIDEAGVLPLVLALVDKSLVIADQRPLGTRYWLLETVRQFAADRLHEHDGGATETSQIHERHARFLIHLANRWRREVMVGQQKTDYFIRLEAELNNARALLSWARGRSDSGALSLELAKALWSLWEGCGHLSEGQAWLEQALAEGVAAPVDVRARALGALAKILSSRSDPGRYEAVSAECLRLAQQIDDRQLMAAALRGLAELARRHSDFERAAVYMEQCLRLHQEDETSAASALEVPAILEELGSLWLQRDEPVKALSYLEEGITLARQADNIAVLYQGMLDVSIADERRSLAWCESEIARLRGSGHTRGLAMSFLALGHVLAGGGEYVQAQDALEHSLRLWDQIGIPQAGWASGGPTAAVFELARLAWLQGHSEPALAQYRTCLDNFQKVGHNDSQARVHLWMAYLALDLRDATSAFEHLAQCLALWRAPWHLRLGLAACARLAEVNGEPVRAAHLYGAAAVHERLVRNSVTPADRIVFDRHMAAAHVKIGVHEWAAAWAEGESMALEEAVTYALAGSGCEYGDGIPLHPINANMSGV